MFDTFHEKAISYLIVNNTKAFKTLQQYTRTDRAARHKGDAPRESQPDSKKVKYTQGRVWWDFGTLGSNESTIPQAPAHCYR